MVDSQLYNGDGTLQFSTSHGVPYAPFAPSATVGDITTNFTVNGTTLTWSNAAFTGGQASFCSVSGTLYAVFTTAPSGCTQMDLSVQNCSDSGYTSAGPSTGLSGTATAQTAPGASTGVGGNSNSGLATNVLATNTIPGNAGPSATSSIAANMTNYCSQEVLNLVPEVVIAGFGTGDINYYCGHTEYYFARFCPVCDVVKVDIQHDTLVYVPCPVCPAVVEQCPGKTQISNAPAEGQKGSAQPASAGNYQYEPPVCPACSAVSALPKIPLTTITVSCQTCPGGSEGIACPTAAASSLASLAKASGAPACEKAAQAAIETAAVAALTMTAPNGATASSTVVNVPCSACAAGSQAVAVPQVAAATGAGPAATPAPQAADTAMGAGGAPPGAQEAAAKDANPNVGGAPPVAQAAAAKDANPNAGGAPPVAQEAAAQAASPTVGGNASLAPGASGAFNNLSSSVGAANASDNPGVVQALKSGNVLSHRLELAQRLIR